MSEPSALTIEAFLRILREHFPTASKLPIEIVTLEKGVAAVRYRAGERDVRPGGTIAGPVLFWLSDLAMYAAVMSVVGEVPLAVTTDATIHFLRPARPGALVARARILKAGQKLVVGEIVIAQEGSVDVAHVVTSFSRPRDTKLA